MSQPRLICQGILKYWIQQEWYRLTAVILANNDNYSLTLTKLSLQSWLSNPSNGVILDMSLSSVLATESASAGSKDGVFLVLLFTKRSTHVLSALSEQDRIYWQGRFEQIIGEEWKFRVTIPCQQDLKQECQGVLRFNTKRRSIIVTYTQDNRGLPSVLYHWTLKSIKSFGANDNLLVLDTSSFSEGGKSYFCFNTTQADQILAVFREATGILPQSSEQANFGRNSARFADIDRVKKAIERNNSSQSAKRGVSSEINKTDDDEILYEMADDVGESRRNTLGKHSSEPARNEVDLGGVNHPPNITADRSDVIDSRHQSSNLARLYHFPSSEETEVRTVHSHMHSVPVMEERIAQALNQRDSPLNLNTSKNPRAVTPQNEFQEARKVKKYLDKQASNPESKKRRSRSRNAFRILSGRSTPRPPDDALSSRASSRPTSPPPPNFLSRALSKLRAPFQRSRDNLVEEEGGELSPRARNESRQKIVSETKSQFRDMKKNYASVPATSHSTQNVSQQIHQLDRPIPPRQQHIPKHPPQPIIVQHPQPIQPLNTSTAPPVPQPGHFVPTQFPFMNNQVLIQNPSYPLPMQNVYPNQVMVNAHQICYTQMQQTVPHAFMTQNVNNTTPIQYTETNVYNKLSDKKLVQTQTNAGIQPQLNTPQTNKQNTPQVNNQNTPQTNNPVPIVNAPHRIIDTSSPIPVNLNTSVVSPPSGFKGTGVNNQQLSVQHQNVATAYIPPLLPSSPVTSPNVTACLDVDIPDTDSGNYDHLSPSQVANNMNNAVFSGVTESQLDKSDLNSPLNPQMKIPPGGQLTPLVLIHTEMQQPIKPSTEYHGVRRQDAFRCSGSTQHKKPPVISPKPIILLADRSQSSEVVDSRGVSRSVGMMDLSGNALPTTEQLIQPPTSPSIQQDVNLFTEC